MSWSIAGRSAGLRSVGDFEAHESGPAVTSWSAWLQPSMPWAVDTAEQLRMCPTF